jgi:hypothetical protein
MCLGKRTKEKNTAPPTEPALTISSDGSAEYRAQLALYQCPYELEAKGACLDAYTGPGCPFGHSHHLLKAAIKNEAAERGGKQSSQPPRPLKPIPPGICISSLVARCKADYLTLQEAEAGRQLWKCPGGFHPPLDEFENLAAYIDIRSP